MRRDREPEKRNAMTLRLPPDIQQRAAEMAASMGLSLNAYICLAVSDHVRWRRRSEADDKRAGHR